MKTIRCQQCGAYAKVRRRGKFCSDACRQSHHRRVRRVGTLRQQYKLGEARARMWAEKQARGPCEICGAQGKLVVDHDHETGIPRGILCGSCNNTIDVLGGQPAERAKRIEVYLRRGKEPHPVRSGFAL